MHADPMISGRDVKNFAKLSLGDGGADVSEVPGAMEKKRTWRIDAEEMEVGSGWRGAARPFRARVIWRACRRGRSS